VNSTLNIQVEIPERLACLSEKVKEANSLSKNYNDFKEYLLNRIS
jgi:hypothetical protein